MATDVELVARARDGDASAFALLVERHQRAVCAVAVSVLGDRSAGEDVAQEAFVRGWSRLGSLKDASRLRFWLCGIARNLARDASRGRKPALPPSQELRDSGEDPESRLAAEGDAALVRRLLERLSPKLRETLVLYYYEERSVEAVATALRISVSAVEQRLSRGRKQLKMEVDDALERRLSRKVGGASLPALVLARIETARAAPAAVPSCGPVRFSWHLGLALVGLAALSLGGGAWSRMAPSAQADFEKSPRTAAPEVQAVQLAARPPHSPEVSAWIDRLERRVDAQTEDDVTPEISYSLTGVPGRGVAVALDGGPADTDPDAFGIWTEYDEGAPIRRVAGTVVDGSGNPVSGAVVLGGGTLWNSPTALKGTEGTTTDQHGRFAFELTTDAVTVAAARSNHAWSRPMRLPAGDDSVSNVVLELEEPARITAKVTRSGMPIKPSIMIEGGEGYVILGDEGSDDGNVAQVLVPPGPVTVIFMESYDLEDKPPGGKVAKTLDLHPGELRHLDVDIPAGALVVFEVAIPSAHFESEKGRQGNYGNVYVISGHHLIESNEDRIRALTDSTLADGHWQPLAPVTEFDDLPSGNYTACAVLYDENATQVCRPFTVDASNLTGDPLVVELVFP